MDDNKINIADDINPIEDAAKEVTPENHKKIDIKFIALVIVVIAVIVFIMLAGNDDSKDKTTANARGVDKNEVSKALSDNMKTFEQQQLYRNRKPADNNVNVGLSQPQNFNPVTEMAPKVATRTPSLPRECIVSGVTEKSDCKMMMARDRAPSTIFVSNRKSFPKSNQQNGDATHATLAGGDANSQFANKTTSTDTVNAKAIPHPDFTVASGELVPAVLESAINSDLPGMVRAVTSMPVYSYTGERVLIPQGSRLIGQYASGVIQTQRRVFVMWNRLILPNGIAVDINSPGTDQIGVSGQGADSYQTHFWARFGQATLLSILGAGVATAGVNSGDEYNSASEYRTTLSSNLQQSAQDSLSDTVANSPTLHVFQGAKINVFIAHDLSFYGIYQQGQTA